MEEEQTPEEPEETWEEEQIREVIEQLVVLAVRSEQDKLTLQFKVQVGLGTTTAIIDTGAQLSIMRKAEAERLGIQWKEVSNEEHAWGVGGNKLVFNGRATITVAANGVRTKAVVYIIDNIK